MSTKPTKEERKAAIVKYDKARDRLNSYKPKGGKEDKEYLRRNDAVVAAEKDVPWWRR